jgi:hypothetical protein
MARLPLRSDPAGQLSDKYGNALAGHKVYVYAHDTTNPVTVYQDESSSATFTQPLVTDKSGEVPGFVVTPVDVDVVDAWTGKILEGAYLDAADAGGGGGGGGGGARGISAGNLGAAYTVDFVANGADQIISGTLNANCTITFSNRSGGCRAALLLAQDGTGGRTLQVSDGSSPQSVAVPSTAGQLFRLSVDCPNPTDLYVTVG